SGAERPVILLYMAGTGNMGPTLAALVPEAFVLSEKGNFEAPNPFHNGFSTWQDALSFAESFGFKASHLWLVGFSAGCWLVREQLRSGAPATVTLAADGIHMALQETEQTLQEQQPWMTLVQEAIQEKSVFFVSVSATPATYSKDTRTTAERLFSWVRCMGSYENPCITSEGYFRISAESHGGGANEHKDQINLLLPRMMTDANRLVNASKPTSTSPGKVALGVAGLTAIIAGLWRLFSK